MTSLFFFLVSLSLAFATTPEKCKTNFDDLGIPHVTTSSEEEFFYCFGYHHGHDRAWEMDYFRRVAQGRNAEVFGFDQLKSDLMMRLLDLPPLAQKIWEDFPADKKKILEWYSNGVNAGLVKGKEAQEFKDQGYQPEAWLPQHSLQVLLIQSFDQTRRTFFMDYEEERTKNRWGEEAARLFEQDDVPWLNTILKEGEYPKDQAAKASSRSREKDNTYPALWANFPQVFGLESGSNNWVVSAKKSKTGHALLANDPHLDLLTPMFWYWIHLKSPQAEVIGASLPGAPVIPSGTNGKVAWGLTNAYINTADAVFVKNVPSSETESIRPTVWVKVGPLQVPFFFKSFDRLKSGHRILPLETKSSLPLALRWSGFSLKAQDILPMFELARVNNLDEMDKLLQSVGLPAWNFVFADTKGEIGHRVIGQVYKMTEKNPYGLSTVSYAELKQPEIFLSSAERPHVLKPSRQYVYSANNRHWPKDSALYGGRGYANSFRGFRIDQLLKTGQHDQKSFQQIQCDTQVVDAQFFIPKLLKHLEVPNLQQWNQIAIDDSLELALYRRWMDLLMEKWEVNEYALYHLLDQLNPTQVEELKQTFKTAQHEVSGREWGEMHFLAFKHMSKNTNWVFSHEIMGVGDTHTVNPGTAKWNADRKLYEQHAGASMRMIIDMGPRPKILLALPGLNRDYSKKSQQSPWMDWKNCLYSEVNF